MAKRTKYRTQQIHFQNACLARVGEVLDNKELSGLVQQNKMEFIDRQSNNITRWKYTYKEKDYMLIYNKQYKQVVTIIPYIEGMENNCWDTYYWWVQ